jgi:hypothetical protein
MATNTKSHDCRRRRRTAGCASRGKQPDDSANPAAVGATDAIVLRPADPADASAPEPRNHRELAQAILAQCDAVKVGRELLESSSEKGASVRARVFETLVNWQFGKTGATPSIDRPNLRIIWDLPGPPHESEDAE